MDFKQGSKMSLLIQLQAAHTLIPGTLADWLFSPPVALANDPDGYNTKIKLTAVTGNVNYTGNRTFRYNRNSLETLKLNAPANPSVTMSAATKVYDCFPYLLKMLGVLFDQDDLENGDVVDNGDGTYTIPLVAKSTCILWKGSWQYKTGRLPHINTAITQPYFDWA
jgi:hypothetical protein